jgi:hypothetical protein
MREREAEVLPEIAAILGGTPRRALPAPNSRPEPRGARIASIAADLESVFARPEPIRYLIDPVLPEACITVLIGESESGKTTLAFAWMRELLALGHAVLYVDRDHNPRPYIVDRLPRLGMQDHPLMKIWDYQQIEEPPQLHDLRCVDWVKQMLAETGKSPFVIGDSLTKFFGPEETRTTRGICAVCWIAAAC